jgi:lambda repressor-like predicted transcriptional regulator
MLASIKSGLLVVTVAGSLVAGPVIAVAQEAPADAPPAAEQTAPASDREHRPAKPRFKGIFMETVMETLGVTKGEVISALRSGSTLAELAEENGSSGEELVDALVAVVAGHLAQAVEDGKITQERADEILANATERITNFVFSTHDGPRGPRDGEGPRFKGIFMETVMETLGVTKGEVISALRSGSTLAELAEENGSSGEELVDALVAVVAGHLAQAVEDGKITQERADEILANATERITNFVFSTHAPGRGASA